LEVYRICKAKKKKEGIFMPLVTLKSVLLPAREGKYAVGAFNFFGIEDARGIIDAACEMNAPVIMMTSPGSFQYFGEDGVAAYIRAMVKNLPIPVVLHLDHCSDFSIIKKCIDTGYTSVMIDASSKSYEENIEMTREVVHYARKFGVSVEAELGRILGREGKIDASPVDSMLTDPKSVPYFCEATGIDALAVSIGTVHGFYKEKPKIDFERIREIYGCTDVPLVMHGGTGVPEEDFVKSIECGIAKINVGTELRYCCSQELRRNCADKPNEIDIRKLVGSSREAVKAIVMHKMELFGCAGKASM